ncbi:MAG: hypothetical protein Ct9H300mP1_17680 [Planctomycetaceae bacterium]|nr:MAG: hypothetical protein Ct9H300mP1_17680 [Planctomycetaceae bacterium]
MLFRNSPPVDVNQFSNRVTGSSDFRSPAGVLSDVCRESANWRTCRSSPRATASSHGANAATRAWGALLRFLRRDMCVKDQVSALP